MIRTLLIYVALATLFGQAFYKISVAGVTFAELFCLWFLLQRAKTLGWTRDFESICLTVVLVVLLGHLVLSPFLAPTSYYLFRQAAIIIYIASFFVMVSEVRRGRMPKTAELATWWAPLFGAFCIWGWANFPGRPSGVVDGLVPATLLIAYLLTLAGRKRLGLLLLVIAVPASLHSAYQIATLILLLGILVARFRGSVGVKLVTVGLIALPGLILVASQTQVLSFLKDANALWRFIYWRDLLAYHWDRSYFLLGDGFGQPFIKPEFGSFQMLLAQIDYGRGAEYQMFTTPPHNSILNLLNYGGIFAAATFVAAVLAIVVRAVAKNSSTELAVVASALTLICSQNILETPFTAIPVMAMLSVASVRTQWMHSSAGG